MIGKQFPPYVPLLMQDWEGYACSRLSLSMQLSSLTELVLEWRKLELK